MQRLPETVTGVAQDVMKTVSRLSSLATALYHVPCSVEYTSAAIAQDGMWKQLGHQAKMWSVLINWKQEGPDIQ